MSYKLEYPYTEEERNNFIVEYNHNQGLRIKEVENIVKIETSHYEPSYDEDGNFIEEILVEDAIEENMPTLYALEANEIMEGGEPVINPNYEAEQEQKELERIAKLYLTGADVERGIYQAKGMDFDDILAFVMANPPQGLDVKALRIELKANHFYRGNPYVNAVGTLLGFTSEQLDKFFETNDYTVLLPAEVEDDNTNNIA